MDAAIEVAFYKEWNSETAVLNQFQSCYFSQIPFNFNPSQSYIPKLLPSKSLSPGFYIDLFPRNSYMFSPFISLFI